MLAQLWQQVGTALAFAAMPRTPALCPFPFTLPHIALPDPDSSHCVGVGCTGDVLRW